MTTIILSRTTGHKAELSDHPRGVLVQMFERPTAPGSKYSPMGAHISEQPFHVVRDRVYDMLRAL